MVTFAISVVLVRSLTGCESSVCQYHAHIFLAGRNLPAPGPRVFYDDTIQVLRDNGSLTGKLMLAVLLVPGQSSILPGLRYARHLLGDHIRCRAVALRDSQNGLVNSNHLESNTTLATAYGESPRVCHTFPLSTSTSWTRA